MTWYSRRQVNARILNKIVQSDPYIKGSKKKKIYFKLKSNDPNNRRLSLKSHNYKLFTCLVQNIIENSLGGCPTIEKAERRQIINERSFQRSDRNCRESKLIYRTYLYILISKTKKEHLPCSIIYKYSKH